MRQRSAFHPEHQFHVLINFNDDERSVAVLPGDKGKFLVVDQGKVLGQLDFDRNFNLCAKCELEAAVITQLNREIKDHYEYTGLFQ